MPDNSNLHPQNKHNFSFTVIAVVVCKLERRGTVCSLDLKFMCNQLLIMQLLFWCS